MTKRKKPPKPKARKRAPKRKLARPKAPAETPAESPAPPPVVMVEQPHGGALRVGGTNRGGGRPTDLFREACRDAFRDAKAIDVVKAMISGDIHEQVGVTLAGAPIYGATKNRDRLGALAFLADHGFGKAPQTVEVHDHRETELGEAVMDRVMPLIGRALQFASQHQRLAALRGIEEAELVVAATDEGEAA